MSAGGWHALFVGLRIRPASSGLAVVGNAGSLGRMCRSIKTLFNFDPPATDEEVYAACLQFVRKLSGFAHPSQGNVAAFDRAVDDTFRVARRLIDSLVTNARPRDRETEAAKARARARLRIAAAPPSR